MSTGDEHDAVCRDPAFPDDSADADAAVSRDPAEELQFEHAEYDVAAAAAAAGAALAPEAEAAASPVACGSCNAAIADAYYEVNGQVTCKGCRDRLVELRTGGRGFGRFARATVFGVVAGILGALIYYAVLAVTGLEIGLIAVLVGLMVGFAVSFGSHQRGGWLYQLLAMGITYCSIVSTYVPITLEMLTDELPEWEEAAQAEAAAAAGEEAVPAAAPPAEEPPGLFSDEPPGLFGGEAPVAGDEGAPETTPTETPTDLEELAAESLGEESPAAEAVPAFEELSPEEQRTAAAVGTALVFVIAVALAFVAPFLVLFVGGFQGILGLLIIGFGVYEAWHLNRRKPFEISGPFLVGPQAAP